MKREMARKQGVRFIRKNGRIIPIYSDRQKSAMRAGLIAGTATGSYVSSKILTSAVNKFPKRTLEIASIGLPLAFIGSVVAGVKAHQFIGKKLKEKKLEPHPLKSYGLAAGAILGTTLIGSGIGIGKAKLAREVIKKTNKSLSIKIRKHKLGLSVIDGGK